MTNYFKILNVMTGKYLYHRDLLSYSHGLETAEELFVCNSAMFDIDRLYNDFVYHKRYFHKFPIEAFEFIQLTEQEISYFNF